MTGMKEGAGEDPFADDEPSDEADDEPTDNGLVDDGLVEDGSVDDEPVDDESNGSAVRRSSVEHGHDAGNEVGDIGESEASSGQSQAESEPDAGTDEHRRGGGTTSASKTESGMEPSADADGDSSPQATTIPYKLRRDSVQDGRNRVPLFLQEDTKTAERNALRELEDRLDEDVSLTDLREALILAGLERLDEAETQLELWGYGMTFDV